MERSSVQDQCSILPHQQETQPLEQAPRGLLLLPPPSVTGQLPGKLGHSSSCISVPPNQCLHHQSEKLVPLPVTVTVTVSALSRTSQLSILISCFRSDSSCNCILCQPITSLLITAANIEVMKPVSNLLSTNQSQLLLLTNSSLQNYCSQTTQTEMCAQPVGLWHMKIRDSYI